MLISKSPCQGSYGKKYYLILNLKKMNLKNLNVVELNAQEVKETEGGWWQAAIVAVVLSAVNNWGDIRDGWSDGASGHPRH